MFTAADPEIQIYVALMIAAGVSLAIGLFVRLLTDPRLAGVAARTSEKTGLLRSAYTRKSTAPPRPRMKGGANLKASAVTQAAENAVPPKKGSRMRLALKIVFALVISVGLFFIHPSLAIIVPLILFSIRDRKAGAEPRGLDGQPLTKPATPKSDDAPRAKVSPKAKAPAGKKLSTDDQADLDMLVATRQPNRSGFIVALLFVLGMLIVFVVAVLA